MKQKIREFTIIALYTATLGTPLSLWAHKARVFAAGEGDRIEGYAYFAGGARARNCSVTLYTMDGRKVGQTKTDAKGTFSFSVHQHCDHKVVLDAGDGHRAEFVVSADELTPAASASEQPAPKGGTVPGTGSDRESETPVVGPGALPPRSVDIARTVDRALARRLRPLEERLDRYEQKVRWHDVAGGIGYILGLAGVFSLLAARRRKPDPGDTKHAAHDGGSAP